MTFEEMTGAAARPPRLRAFTGARLDEIVATSRTLARRRANLNVHPDLTDPIQRLANVIQPGSYIRPHRHDPEKWELFLLLRGSAGVLLFADDGTVTGSVQLGAGDAWAVEIPGGAFHTAFALEADTVLFEVKPGPYRPLEEQDFAPWAPREGDTATGEAMAAWLAALGASRRDDGAEAAAGRSRDAGGDHGPDRPA